MIGSGRTTLEKMVNAIEVGKVIGDISSDREHRRSVEEIERVNHLRPEQRRIRRLPNEARSLSSRFWWRLRYDTQFLRTMVQAVFILLCIWIGIEFHLFVRWGLTGGESPYVTRPPGVEGFLPISGLISLKYWLQTGIVNTIHPSALFILLAIMATGIFLKKAFCSWLCPVGTLSESLWMFGERLFGRTLTVTKWIDIPLRSLKYLLLLFFVNAIGQMDTEALRQFVGGPYNRMADVKMYLFFANISTFAFWTVVLLMVFSVVIKNFWCRYLCPYGGLLGLLSLLSPLKVTRQKATCINCELCTKACPSAITVHKAMRVWSDECTACYKCVDVCPVKNTLDLRPAKGQRAIPGWLFGGLVAGVFVAITGLAMLAGTWQNSISRDEYSRRFKELDTPAYEHFGAEGVQRGTGR